MPRILVVDDAQFLRVRLSKLLNEHGHEVTEASNGAEAVETYKSVRPDAVIMDITMPEKDGLEALSEIKALDANARVIMLTALGQESMVMRAVQSGARDFIVKPFEPDRVLSALQRVLG